MNQVIQKLKEGDLRQKGKSEEVVADVLKKPQLFQDLVAGISDAEPGVRMRASDAARKDHQVASGISPALQRQFHQCFRSKQPKGSTLASGADITPFGAYPKRETAGIRDTHFVSR